MHAVGDLRLPTARKKLGSLVGRQVKLVGNPIDRIGSAYLSAISEAQDRKDHCLEIRDRHGAKGIVWTSGNVRTMRGPTLPLRASERQSPPWILLTRSHPTRRGQKQTRAKPLS